MSIPIRNLYWLLCYAWDVLDQAGEAPVDETETPEAHDLLAKLLAEGTRHVLRRGLDRDYIEHREDRSSLRGRIDLQQTVSRQLRLRSQAHVVFDELSPDIPANRAVKAAAQGLRRVRELDAKQRDSLSALCRALPEVSDVPLSPSLMRSVRLHRNNRSYGLLMEICRLVMDCLIADESGQGAKFRDFVRDEHRMRALFEEFVLNFYKREQSTYSAHADGIEWQDADVLVAGEYRLPQMRTDVTLRRADEVFVIDTKYTPSSSGSYYGSEAVRSDHLYQIWAYATNFRVKERAGTKIRALLLYPAVEQPFRSEWTIQGMRIGAAGIPLNANWPEIKSALLELIDQ